MNVCVDRNEPDHDGNEIMPEPRCTVVGALWAWFARAHEELGTCWLLEAAPAPYGLCAAFWHDHCDTTDTWINPADIPF